jgi:selenide,water dikinase
VNPIQPQESESIRLTQYSKGSGCGCKMAPTALKSVLGASFSNNTEEMKRASQSLLVGHGEADDAAVVDLGNGTGLVCTTDFFGPLVDDAYQFGRIAATNALSDVYAMGGKPLVALAVLGWPVDVLPTSLAAEVLRGGRDVCTEAGIALGGGHSVDNPEPLFGLAVTGLVDLKNLKRNGGAMPGDSLYLTKPLGTGMVASAIKKGLATPEDLQWLLHTAQISNQFGAVLGTFPGVHALTDVTGFGLGGHLLEMLNASEGNRAELDWSSLPTLPAERLTALAAAFCMPQNTTRNFTANAADFPSLSGPELMLLFDPQTSGGLLAAVSPESEDAVAQAARNANQLWVKIGTVLAASQEQKRVEILR